MATVDCESVQKKSLGSEWVMTSSQELPNTGSSVHKKKTKTNRQTEDGETMSSGKQNKT